MNKLKITSKSGAFPGAAHFDAAEAALRSLTDRVGDIAIDWLLNWAERDARPDESDRVRLERVKTSLLHGLECARSQIAAAVACAVDSCRSPDVKEEFRIWHRTITKGNEFLVRCRGCAFEQSMCMIRHWSSALLNSSASFQKMALNAISLLRSNIAEWNTIREALDEGRAIALRSRRTQGRPPRHEQQDAQVEAFEKFCACHRTQKEALKAMNEHLCTKITHGQMKQMRARKRKREAERCRTSAA